MRKEKVEGSKRNVLHQDDLASKHCVLGKKNTYNNDIEAG